MVVAKELPDNALDACEEAGTAPEIDVTVSRGAISITDNGPGIAADTVVRLLDYQTKTSSREAYVGPSRGAQGNALQALLAMPFALDGKSGEALIESRGIAHQIIFTIDPVRRVPQIAHDQRRSLIQSGTRITLRGLISAGSQADPKVQIVQVVRNFAWLNPHAAFTVNGKTLFKASDPGWRKWRPSDAAPAAWYDRESFSRLIAACIADDEDHGRDRTVREFIADFRGLARTGMQKQVLDNTTTARMSLRDFFKRPARVKHLLAVMQDATKPVGAKDLGVLGREHFQTRFAEVGADLETFQYRRSLLAVDDVPFAIEAAFGYCPDEDVRQQQIVGVNWSPSLINPFRDLNNDISLDYLLAEQRAGEEQPIVLALHLASPCIAYTDKAKSALALPDEVAARLVMAVKGVTERWAKQCKQEERDASARDRRHERLIRSRKESQTDVAFGIMEKGYLKVSDDGHGGRLPANARQIMYACRDEIQERSERMLSDNYFTQTLLPDFMTTNPELTADWDVTFDDRGHFT
ncbi:MAG: hypothetical protein ACXWJR_04120, partial [Xanthobacteraceae bacterium]